MDKPLPVCKILFTLFVSGTVFVNSVSAAFANSDYFIAHDINYNLSPTGSAQVTQKVTITNLQPNSFPTKYALNVKGKILNDVKATDSQGSLPLLVERIEGEYRLLVNLRENIVGKDKSQTLTLTYQLDEVAKRNGRIWQIQIPETHASSGIDEAQTTLTVPTVLGRPAYIYPSPIAINESENSLELVFKTTKENIVAAFGEFQIFDFNIAYHLYNPDGHDQNLEIALPPDTNYQRVYYTHISPKPSQVNVDPDGNWLGIYKLKAGESMDIQAQGYTHIYAYPQPFPVKESPGFAYLAESQVWPTSDPQITSLNQMLKTPRQIYDFVLDHLEYNYDRLEGPPVRLGGKLAFLEAKNAACREFTDLFITLARGAGIPAREINGFGFTNNARLRPLSQSSDILHAWPEYYDENEKTWIQVDPTWADTTGGQNYFDKLDTDHFAFVVHGQSPEYPPAAGSYKTSASEKKEIEVTPGKMRIDASPKIDVDFRLPYSLMPFIAQRGRVIVRNSSPGGVYNLNAKLESNLLELSNPASTFEVIPPYGSASLDTKFKLSNLFPISRPKVTLAVNGQKFEYNMPFASYLVSLAFIPSMTIVTIFISIKLIKYVSNRRN